MPMATAHCGSLLARHIPFSSGLRMQSTNLVKKIAIEGNIGAGKSTFLSILQSNFNFRAVPEPIADWQNVASEEAGKPTENLLDLFYKDPKRWAYTFQTYACLTRVRSQLAPPPADLMQLSNPVLFYERSVYSDRYCFMDNCYKSGLINEMEWRLYCDWHTHLLGALGGLHIDGIVYLRVKPEVCMERLKHRNRSEESTVGLDYLSSIHEQHEKWLMRKETKISPVLKNVPVFVLESDQEFQTDHDRQVEMVGELKDFLANCSSTEVPADVAAR
ncbi:deoxycytidine kinase 2-like [Sycon ciliatum]|uniref:deoxycytidine kinase 2-like n=1 Tax=Sycon ciliatum TaxID=27933 RepID=UPI0031F70CB7